MTAFRWQHAATAMLTGAVALPATAQREVILEDGQVIKGPSSRTTGRRW